MTEINKISPAGNIGLNQKPAHQAKHNDDQKFRELLKSAEVFSKEVDQMIQKAETDSVNGKVDTVGKTIDTLGEIASQMVMKNPHAPTKQSALERYEKQDSKTKA